MWRVTAVVLFLLTEGPRLQGQDVFSSGGAPAAMDGGIVIGVTPLGNGDCDVKIKNPRTHYVHSRTVPCDTVSRGRTFLPKVLPSRDAPPQFAKALSAYLDSIQRAAAADPGSPVNNLLKQLAEAPVTVQPRPPKDESNVTPYSPPGKPVSLTWSPSDNGRYAADGASKSACATLLHELTHAWENYNGLDNGELQAVRAENWLIWKQGGTQRTRYNGNALPRDQVIWPAAGR